MIKSMTGFGRGEYADANHHLIVEIKAVNHRYNEIAIRMPKNLSSLEDKIRRTVSNTLLRGRIDIYITLDEYGQKNRMVRVDKALAIAYHNALRELAEMFSVIPNDTISNLARYPDVLRVEDISEDTSVLWPKLLKAIEEAIHNLMEMRVTEGKNIEIDLLRRLNKLEEYVKAVENRAPLILEEYRNKLLLRMRDLLATLSTEPDEARILQEAALYSDRICFTEELVRLTSHLAQFKSTLSANDAVGRKLDFIVQEINRETNTIASKANDFTVANIVVEIKSEIEKVREQIQNIE